jgi:8-hydroxy-5-deazaflavin:NADPH oxidoreductase
VSGFQSLPAAHLARPGPVDQDVLVCGDDEEAKRTALDLGERLVAGRAIDAGPLMNARALEGMTAVILHVNRRYRVVAGLRLTGFQ